MVQIKANLLLLLLAGSALATPLKPMPKPDSPAILETHNGPSNHQTHHNPAQPAKQGKRKGKSKQPQQSQGRTLQCTVDGKTIKIPENAAKEIAKKAPSGTQFLKDPETRKSKHRTPTNYPHHYGNGEELKWDNQACNSKNVKTQLLEFPLLEDSPTELYDWNPSKGKETKGKNDKRKITKETGHPCRVVYSATDGHYCGVMCHPSMDPKKDSSVFKKCS